MGMSHSAPEFVRDEGRRYLATDLPCEDCGAVVGERCAGTRICVARMQLAAQLARDGEIQSHGPARDIRDCPDCARMNGVACAANGHQCAKRVRDGQQCKYAVVPGSKLCETHANQQPGGRKPLLTEDQVVEGIKRQEAGERWQDIAASMGVGQSTLTTRVKRYREKQKQATSE